MIVAQDALTSRGIPFRPGNPGLKSADGKPIRTTGYIDLRLSIPNGGPTCCTTALVSPEITEHCLVAWHILQSLKILSPVFPAVAYMAKHKLNTDALEARIRAKYAGRPLSDLLSDKPMSGGNMHVQLNAGSTPVHVRAPRKVPIRFEEEANSTIAELLRKGVIKKVEDPTPWCSPAFFVPKPDNVRVRLVTDYTALNKFVNRPIHPFPSSREIMQSVAPGSCVFAKLDAVHGYFQVGLDEESSLLTTFLLPSG